MGLELLLPEIKNYCFYHYVIIHPLASTLVEALPFAGERNAIQCVAMGIFPPLRRGGALQGGGVNIISNFFQYPFYVFIYFAIPKS